MMSIYTKDYGQFFYYVVEDKVSVGYKPLYREFYINLIDSPASQLINYCPWTGKKLPSSLRNLYFEIVENEVEVSDEIKKLMENKGSEAWWIKLEMEGYILP